jgi:hypothetical protein
MADTACVRAWEDEGWGPYHKRLLTMCVSLESKGWKKVKGMTKLDIVLNHLSTTGSISIREAMDDYGMSGGALTKYISILRRDYDLNIITQWKSHPVTGARYARYRYVSDMKAAA